VLQALSALAVRTGLAPRACPRWCSRAHLFERAVLAGAGRRRTGASSIAFNLRRWSARRQALRERLSSEHWGLIRGMGEASPSALHTPGGELPTLPRCCRRWTAWRCSWPPPPARRPTA
jgi:hypothetical protein